jgi:tripartite-type tricarboxylate transporter receptor subunit TctC
MSQTRRSLLTSLAAASAASALAPWGAFAQAAYPTRPVKVIVPYAAGGGTDFFARLVAEGLSNLTGQRFVVENRVGAGGIIAAESVARAEPDGYTLLYANTSVLAVNPALQPKLPYDAATAFESIGFVSSSPQLLIANPKLPVKTVRELVAYAKANPGKLNFASGGVGSLPHLTYELFRMESGIDAVHVPYAGGGPATNALMAGQADVLFDLVRTRVRTGEVRALALTGEARDPDLPDIPTMAESGYPAMTSSSITGVVAPAGTPREVITILNVRLNDLIRSPEFVARMKSFGLVPRGGPPEDLSAWVSEAREKWTRVVKVSGAKPN